jgi:hypothetical protein
MLINFNEQKRLSIFYSRYDELGKTSIEVLNFDLLRILVQS